MRIVYQSTKTYIYKTPSKCTHSPPQIIRQQPTPPTKRKPKTDHYADRFPREKGNSRGIFPGGIYCEQWEEKEGQTMVSPAQRFATEQYKRRHYDFTAVRLPAGQRQRLKEYAYSTGRSMSGLIIQAIRELLERENCTSVEV